MNEKALVGNTADVEQVKKAAREERFSIKDAQLQLKRVLETRDGRDVLFQFLEFCGLYKQSFTSGQDSVTAFNDGRRVVGLMILDKINEVGEDYWLTMQKEHQKKK